MKGDLYQPQATPSAQACDLREGSGTETLVLIVHDGVWNPSRQIVLEAVNRVLRRLESGASAISLTRTGQSFEIELQDVGSFNLCLSLEQSNSRLRELLNMDDRDAIYVLDGEGTVLWCFTGNLHDPDAIEDLAHHLSEDKTPRGGLSRRNFLAAALAASLALAILPPQTFAATAPDLASQSTTIHLSVNGRELPVQVEPNVTLLDALRERLGLTGTKKGCDHGQCGACTVHVDGRRVNSCLLLAIMQQGKRITTIEGLALGEKLHPVQEAFIKHDGFQCGYCTSGQIMSAAACIREGHASSEDEIRRWMSGNLCRCGAYVGIREAILAAEGKR